ncbi:hypothetical protein [Neisseria sp.]
MLYLLLWNSMLRPSEKMGKEWIRIWIGVLVIRPSETVFQTA